MYPPRMYVLLPIALAAFACGDADSSSGADAAPATTDISSWYQVTTHQTGDCGATADPIAPASHVWVEPLQDLFYVRLCSGTDSADCFSTPFYDFSTPITAGWSAGGGSAFYSAECTLSWEHSEAKLSGNQLTVKSFVYTDYRAIPEAQCTLEAAETLTEPCTYETEIVATSL